MTEPEQLAACVILHEPRDPVNIAGTVRAMKNMGVHELRLVRAVEYEASAIEKIAHGTSDIVERIRHFESLEAAISDCVLVAGYTARRRAAKRQVLDARAAAAEIVSRATSGRVGLLFGPEQSGLSNESLDRAHLVVTIPTTDYASLNLAQGVLLALYEVHVCAAGLGRSLAPPRKDAPAATSEQYERLFADAERALSAMDFFKTRYAEHVMRTIRSLTYRATPDAREVELARAMAIEVLRTLDRVSRRGPG